MSRGRVVTLSLAGVSLAGLAIVAVLPSLGRLGWAPDVPVAEVTREPFARKVYAEGNLKAVEATPVTAPVDAEGPFKIAWLAPDGSRVAAGDVVVRFDPTEMEKNLQDGKSDRATAEQKTIKRRAERDATLEGLSQDADLARLELRYAREFQSKDPEIFSKTEIIESDIDETLATHREESAQGRRAVQEELADADLDLLGIERHKAQLKIQEAQQGLNALEIRAPHDGILVYQRNWRGDTVQVGQSVWNGQPIAEIPRLDEMEAEVFVLEADAGGLKPDVKATVAVESRPGEPFEASIQKVDAVAKQWVRWVPVQYFGVTLKLERTDPAIMKPGQRVRATLVLDEIPDALVVPREAVFESEGDKIVYRRNGWEFEPVKVELGASALSRVVLTSGVEAGDVVALQDPTHRTRPAAGASETASTAPSPTRGTP